MDLQSRFDILKPPFKATDLCQIKVLIEASDLVCNTEELPEYGVAVRPKGTWDITGYIGGHGKYGKVAHVDILVVDSGTRDKGIATLLINDICKEFLEEGYTSFTAEVEADNPSAIKLYLKLGAELKMSFGLNIPTQTVIDTTNRLSEYHERPREN